MSSATTMFSTVSGAVELPKTFVNSLRILFDILDEDKDGLVPISVIEQRWQGDGISGLPNGVLQSLRKVTPADGMLDFGLFCSALKLTLKTNKEQAKNKMNRQPNRAAVKPNNYHPMHAQEDNFTSPHTITSHSHTRPSHIHRMRVPYPVGPVHKLDSGNGSVETLKQRNLTEHRETNVEHTAMKSRPVESSVTRTSHTDISHSSPREDRTLAMPVNIADSVRPAEMMQSSKAFERAPPLRQNQTQLQPLHLQDGGKMPSPSMFPFPHRRNPPRGNYMPPDGLASDNTRTGGYGQHDRLPPSYEVARSRSNMMSPPSQRKIDERVVRQMSTSSSKSRPSTSSSSSGVFSPIEKEQQLKSSVIKSPPPYMAQVKPQSQKVIKAQLVYPQSNPSQTRFVSPPREIDKSAPTKTKRHRRKEEPRRHTLSNGITTDFNALKRMKDLEQERDVLHQGLDLLDRCRDWYTEELLQIKEQQHQLISGKEMNGSSRQDRVTFRTSRIMEINRQMRALMNSTEAFPEHMNLAMPQKQAAPDQNSPMMGKLRDQNKRLTQEVSFKNDRIEVLAKEKDALIRQLFDVRGRSRKMESPVKSTLF